MKQTICYLIFIKVGFFSSNRNICFHKRKLSIFLGWKTGWRRSPSWNSTGRNIQSRNFPYRNFTLFMEFSPKFWLEISPRKSPRNWKRKFPQRNSPRSRKGKFPRRNSLYRKRPRSIFPRNFDCKTWGKWKKKNLQWEGLEPTVPWELLIML